MSDYHRLPIAQKRAEALARAREQPIACRRCRIQLMPADLLAHRPRCSGRHAPGPRDKWVRWPEALALGIAKATLKRRVDKGLIRIMESPGGRLYLHRDLVIEIDLLLDRRR